MKKFLYIAASFVLGFVLILTMVPDSSAIDDEYQYNGGTDTATVTTAINSFNCSISGFVYEGDGVTLIEGATVKVQNWDAEFFQFVGEGTTNASGAYVISGLDAGDYRVVAFATGRAYELYHETYLWDEAQPISATDGEDTPNINFSLDPGGTISGLVTSADSGVPLSQVSVLASYADSSPVGGSALSDPSGNYTITSLPYGTYIVRSPSDWRFGTSDDSYLMEFWQEKSNWDDADTVIVSEVVHPTDIDFTLEVGGTISGVVEDEFGGPIEGAWVYASGDDISGSGGNQSTEDGSYTITGLPSGNYRVYAQAPGYIHEYYNGAYFYDEATLVSVTAPNDTPNINFTLELGGTISGHVYEEDGTTPIPNLHVQFWDYDTNIGMGGTNTDEDGSYSLLLPSGTYRVRACSSCSGLPYVDEYYDDTYDYNEATPVSVTAPDDTPNIDFTLEVGGTISGHVYEENGVTPIPNLDVFATDYDTNVWTGGTNTDEDGSYSLVLPAGTYRVRACASCSGLPYVDEFYDDTYDYDEATPVSVTAPDDTPNIDFILALGGSISGHVYQDDGVTPIADCSVCSDTADGEQRWCTGTDLDGSYTIIGLPDGEYKVNAQCDPYAGEYWEEKTHWDEADIVSVTTPNDTPNIDFTLEVGGTISGHVYESDGVTPIPNVHVQAGIYDTGVWIEGVNTDEAGSYSLLLPSGTYRVATCASCNELPYIDEYYDDTYYYDEATPVPVTAPNDTPNIDFILEVGGSISGHVYEEDGVTPIPNLRVHVWDYDSGAGFGGSQTSGDGSYTISNLPTGTYRVQTCSSCDGLPYIDEYYDDTYYYSDATPVSVTAPDDIPNIDFILEVGGSISGHVYQDNGVTPIADCSVCSDTVDGEQGWCTSTDLDGSYTIIGLPDGEYKVNAQCEPYAREYWQEKTHWDEANIVSVTAPNDTPGIDFTLKVGGTIAGHVYQEDGVTPIPNVHVYASDYATGIWMGGTNTNVNGSYSMILPTGTYRVATCAFCCSGPPYVDEYYSDTYDYGNATPVSVTAPDDTSDIDFALASILPRGTPEEAIEDGVAWLAGEQNLDGSWGTVYALAKTAMAVLNLETYAMNLGYPSPFDPAYPYHAQVESGLDYIFENAYVTGIGVQPAGDPDGDGDDIGVYFYIPGEGHDPETGFPIYNTAMVMMAIAAGNVTDRVVTVPGSAVDGWTYEDVLQDTVDYMAWAQTDSGYGRGGWNYGPTDNDNERSDQSNSGWVTLGLAYAEAEPPEGFDLDIPGFVKTELDLWIGFIQDPVDGDDDDGGSHYADPADPEDSPVNILKTGNLLQQMEFVGDANTTTRVLHAIDYLVRHWGDPGDPGWRGCPNCYQTTYTAMKGLEALEVEYIDSIDWFGELTAALLSEQTLDGWWPVSCFDDGERILSTDWALLTLQKAAIISPPNPDLVIIDKYEEWIDEGNGTYKVFYTVKNRGDLEALSGHDVGLNVDGADIELKAVPVALAPGASYSDSFEAVALLTDSRDQVTVCADIHGEVEERNEDNNCLTNIWPLEYQAITSFDLGLDTDDCAGGDVSISEVQDPDTGDPVPVLIGGYQAELHYDGSILQVLDVRLKPPFDTGVSDINNAAGLTQFNGIAPSGAIAPVDLAFLPMRIVGCAHEQCEGTLIFNDLVDFDGNPLGTSPPEIGYIFRRGDARVDGIVNIADALFIAQYLVGVRDLGDGIYKVQAVNAASVKHDNGCDEINIADVLFICQYLVGQRDECFNMIPIP